MGIFDTLFNQGWVPGGAQPKAVVTEGGEPGYFPTDQLSTAVREFKKIQAEEAAKEEVAMKKMEKKSDMYQTLRDQGYEPKRAYEAVKNMKFPEELPTQDSKEDLDQNKKRADIAKTIAETEVIPSKNAPKLQAKIIQKIANGENLTNGEQKIYDETIKRKGDDLSGILTDKDKEDHITTKERILKKVADGDPLTPGELQLYNDVFVKPSELESIGKQTETTGTDYIPMVRPDGQLTKVHKDDVLKALKKGYKRR